MAPVQPAGRFADGVDLVTDELVVGGEERSPVEVVGQPGGDAGQPGERPGGGGRGVLVVGSGGGEMDGEVVDAGVEYCGGVAGVGQRPGGDGVGEQGQRVVLVEGEEREVGAQGRPGGGIGEPGEECFGVGVDACPSRRGR